MYFELQHHAPQLKKIIDDEHSRLRNVQQKLLEVEKKQEKIEDRVDRAAEIHSSLEERLRNLRSLPGSQKKPLSKAEREFKIELGNSSTPSCILTLKQRSSLCTKTARCSLSIWSDDSWGLRGWLI